MLENRGSPENNNTESDQLPILSLTHRPVNWVNNDTSLVNQETIARF
jgi:mRNA deadenylase 3'-5' endonuclease subunit Ccr4